MTIWVDQVDDVLQARVEQFGGEHGADHQRQHDPASDVETQQRGERDRDDGENDLDPEVRLIGERLTYPVDRIGDGVREIAIANVDSLSCCARPM
jgi:hypothetical protein